MGDDAGDEGAAEEQADGLAALMASAQAGDAAAYATLLHACVKPAGAVARRLGVRPEAVDDVVQDTLMTVHRALPTYDPSRPFLPWLRAIANRRAIDMLRLHGRLGARELHDPAAALNQAEPGEGAEGLLSQHDEARSLRVAIAALPPQQRRAVELLGLQERSLDEAARQTGASKVALKVNLHRALRGLRRRLGERGGV